MSRNLLSYNLLERIKLSNALSEVVTKYGYPPTSHEAMQEAIPILRKRLDENPKDLLFWFVLADHYLSLDDFVSAFNAAERCYQIQPKEPRSAYSLGTILRVLLSARHLDNPRLEQANSFLSQIDLGGVDAKKCSDALDDLGLTIEQAAMKAVSLFRKVLSSDIDDASRKHVREILQSLYDSFPQLGPN